MPWATFSSKKYNLLAFCFVFVLTHSEHSTAKACPKTGGWCPNNKHSNGKAQYISHFSSIMTLISLIF